MQTQGLPQEHEFTSQMKDGPDPFLLDRGIADVVKRIWATRDGLAAQARGNKRYRSYWAWSAAILGPIAILALGLRATGAVKGGAGSVCASVELVLVVLLLCLGLAGPVSRTIRSRGRPADATGRLPLLWPVWMLLPPALAAALAHALHIGTPIVTLVVLGLLVAVPAITLAFHGLGLEASHCRWVSARGEAEALKRDAWLVAVGLLRAETTGEAVGNPDDEAVRPPVPLLRSSQPPFTLALHMCEGAPADLPFDKADGLWADYRAKRVERQLQWFGRKAREHRARDTWYEVAALLALSLASALSAVGLCEALGADAGGIAPLLTAIHIAMPPLGASALLLRSLDSGHHLAASYTIHREMLRAVRDQLADADADACQALSPAQLQARIVAVEGILMEELICWWLAVRCEEVRAV